MMHSSITTAMISIPCQTSPRHRAPPPHEKEMMLSPLSSTVSSFQQRGGYRMLLLLCYLVCCCCCFLLQLPFIEASTRRHIAGVRHPPLPPPFGIPQRTSRHDAVDDNDDEDSFDRNDIDDMDNDDDDEFQPQHQQLRIHIIPAAWILQQASASPSAIMNHHHHRRPWRDHSSNNDNEVLHSNEEEDDDVMMMTPTTTMMVQPPRMKLQDMAHVLQFTSHLNAQIQKVCRRRSGSSSCCTTSSGTTTTCPLPTHVHVHPRIALPRTPQYHHGRMDDLRGGGGGMVRTTTTTRHDHRAPYRIRTTPYHHQEVSTTSSYSPTDVSHQLNHHPSAFHSDSPVEHDLHDFLWQIHHVLLDNVMDHRNNPNQNRNTTDTSTSTALERTLMMLYLDRACSGTTSGHCSQNHHHSPIQSKLPYCTPSTVHHLCVTAMLVAAGTVRGDLVSLLAPQDEMNHHHDNDNIVTRNQRILQQSPYMQWLFQKLETQMGIPVTDSQHRVSLMLQALAVGQPRSPPLEVDSMYDEDDEEDVEDDSGIFVTPAALQEWKEQWESRFDGI